KCIFNVNEWNANMGEEIVVDGKKLFNISKEKNEELQKAWDNLIFKDSYLFGSKWNLLMSQRQSSPEEKYYLTFPGSETSFAKPLMKANFNEIINNKTYQLLLQNIVSKRAKSLN